MDGGIETGWKETMDTVIVKEPIVTIYGRMMVIRIESQIDTILC